MSRHILFLVILSLLIFVFSIAFSDSKLNAEIILLSDNIRSEILTQPNFGAAELCSVRHVDKAYYLAQHWLAGNEQYLVYQDPFLTCSDPYPFAITEVFMVLYCAKNINLSASATIMTTDLTDPSCPVPGEILSESSEYNFELYQGLWRIVIHFDEPILINEPYFASFNILNQFSDPNLEIQDSIILVTDSIPSPCQNYNLRDGNIGYVDLGDGTDEHATFLGNLLLYSAGYPGGYLPYTCGDVDNDGVANTFDIVYLIEYYFGAGPAPDISYSGDMNCDGIIGLLDLILLNRNLFHGGAYECCD